MDLSVKSAVSKYARGYFIEVMFIMMYVFKFRIKYQNRVIYIMQIYGDKSIV